MTARVVRFNKAHKRGMDPEVFGDAPAPVLVETVVNPMDVGPGFVLPALLEFPGDTKIGIFFDHILGIIEQSEFNITDPQVRTDILFGLHCLQAAAVRQAGGRHPLHQFLSDEQLGIAVHKYLAERV